MNQVWLYSLLSVGAISLLSLVGVFTLSIRVEKLKHFMVYMISFSAGALLGDAFLHLLPELVSEIGFSPRIGLYILCGIAFSFIIEKIIHWRHCHHPITSDHKHPFAWMNLIGDGVHNFIDGLIIAVSYLASIPLGIATTIAVILHEVPQEIGDFGVLLYSGLKKSKALFYNLLSALVAIIGAVIGLVFASETFISLVIPFAAGGFIYIAGSDLIPELHKECGPKDSFWHIFALILGIGLMVVLKFIAV